MLKQDSFVTKEVKTVFLVHCIYIMFRWHYEIFQWQFVHLCITSLPIHCPFNSHCLKTQYPSKYPGYFWISSENHLFFSKQNQGHNIRRHERWSTQNRSPHLRGKIGMSLFCGKIICASPRLWEEKTVREDKNVWWEENLPSLKWGEPQKIRP